MHVATCQLQNFDIAFYSLPASAAINSEKKIQQCSWFFLVWFISSWKPSLNAEQYIPNLTLV